MVVDDEDDEPRDAASNGAKHHGNGVHEHEEQQVEVEQQQQQQEQDEQQTVEHEQAHEQKDVVADVAEQQHEELQQQQQEQQQEQQHVEQVQQKEDGKKNNDVDANQAVEERILVADDVMAVAFPKEKQHKLQDRFRVEIRVVIDADTHVDANATETERTDGEQVATRTHSDEQETVTSSVMVVTGRHEAVSKCIEYMKHRIAKHEKKPKRRNSKRKFHLFGGRLSSQGSPSKPDEVSPEVEAASPVEVRDSGDKQHSPQSKQEEQSRRRFTLFGRRSSSRGSSSKPEDVQSLQLEFDTTQIPPHDHSLESTLDTQRVALEQVEIHAPVSLVIRAQVANIAFDKQVRLHHTFDNWQTVETDIEMKFVDCKHPSIDRFEVCCSSNRNDASERYIDNPRHSEDRKLCQICYCLPCQ